MVIEDHVGIYNVSSQFVSNSGERIDEDNEKSGHLHQYEQKQV